MKEWTFEGWYFKHQRGNQMAAFIPGRAAGGAFVQMITPLGSRQFAVPEIIVENGVIRAGDCVFTRRGCRIDLPGVKGEILYGPWQPLRSEIMGPFRHLTMECRHGVLSMGHSLKGSVTIDGVRHCFDGGTGYAEKDSGRSFPKWYQWMQCNSFPGNASVMVSVASIPLWGLRFRGCICAIIHEGYEYRFATYLGVRIHTANPRHICLSQGKFLLELDMEPKGIGHALAAPVAGQMSATIRECCNASVRVRLWEGEKQIFDLYSDGAAYEFVTSTRS